MFNNIFVLFFTSLFVSFLIALFITPLAIKLAWKLKIVDEPKVHKRPKDTHTYPVPRGGGLPIIIALVITTFLFLPPSQHLYGILAGALLAAGIGFVDDRFDLNPYLRLLTCLLAAGIVITAGIGIEFVSNPLGGIIDLSRPTISFDFFGEQRNIQFLSALFTLFWITWCMNFVGWAGGIEGQLPGFVAIAAVVIGISSLRFASDTTQWPVTILAAITAGAYLGFLPFNFYPQKIMPGYSGKSLAGFLLAVLSILATTKVGTLIVVLGIPLADACYALLRRILSGRSPVWGDRGHLHHRLLDLGWSKRKIAIFYWLVTLVLGVSALNLNSQQKFYTIVMVAALLGGFFLWVTYFTKSSSPPGQNSG